MYFFIKFSELHLNSLAPGRLESNVREVIFKPMLVIDGWGIPCKIALRCMSLDLTDNKSTMNQVMAWCHHATSHYLSQCSHKSMSPHGVTWPLCKQIYTNFNQFLWYTCRLIYYRVPTDKRRKISMIFQWYFKTKIPNFPDNSERYKMEKRRTKCYTWAPHTCYDHYWVLLRKFAKSSYFIWWMIYQ